MKPSLTYHCKQTFTLDFYDLSAQEFSVVSDPQIGLLGIKSDHFRTIWPGKVIINQTIWEDSFMFREARIMSRDEELNSKAGLVWIIVCTWELHAHVIGMQPSGQIQSPKPNNTVMLAYWNTWELFPWKIILTIQDIRNLYFFTLPQLLCRLKQITLEGWQLRLAQNRAPERAPVLDLNSIHLPSLAPSPPSHL